MSRPVRPRFTVALTVLCMLSIGLPGVLAGQDPPPKKTTPVQPSPLPGVLSPRDAASLRGASLIASQQQIPVVRVTPRAATGEIPRGANPSPAPLSADLGEPWRIALPDAPVLEPEVQQAVERVRAISGPAPLTWTERRTVLVRSGISVPERPTPPSEFTLTVRRPWIDGVAWLGFHGAIAVDAVANEAIVPGNEGWVDITLTLEADSRYLLDFALTSDLAATYYYLAEVADGRAPEIPLPAGGQHLLIVIETSEAGRAYQLVSARGWYFGFHSLTVTKID